MVWYSIEYLWDYFHAQAFSKCSALTTDSCEVRRILVRKGSMTLKKSAALQYFFFFLNMLFHCVMCN